jgi:CBS domain-containing protein
MNNASISNSASETLKVAAARMWEQQTGSLLVMDGDELLGIATERDILKAMARGLDPEQTTVNSIMTRNVLTISPDTPLHEAARHMAARWIRHLPVVDGGKVVGMLSQRDLLAVFAALVRDDDAMPLASDQLVRAKRLVRIEAGDLD